MYVQTERLIIRELAREDLENHHKLLSNKEAMYYLDDIMTNSLEESEANLLAAIQEIENPNRKFYFFAICDLLNGGFIGEIGYTVTETLPIGKLVGLGYFILPEFWRKGYTAEALKKVMEFAFMENDVFRISTGCIKENSASEKVMIKCGMVKEAEFKSFVWHDGQIKDRVEYRMLRSDWGFT